jgi:integrating conjugative element protein (TIGR03752 family)
MTMSSNKLLPIFGSAAIALVIFIGTKSCTSRSEPPSGSLKEVPQAPAADADSPGDTLRTLTAQVAAMQQQAEQLRKSNEDVLQQKNQLDATITHKVREDLRRETKSEQENALAGVMRQIEEMGQRIQNAQQVPPPSIGNSMDSTPVLPPASDSIRVEPLNATGLLGQLGATVAGFGSKVANPLSGVANASGRVLHGLDNNPIVGSHLPAANSTQAAITANLPEPVYTVPRNATLMGSTGMTALIGRVPFKGHVDDPYPFKIIVGADNLAANGLAVPGVDGMVFSGEAIGDWALSCVRGQVHSVTFVFEDGTIRTLSSDDQSLQQKSQQATQESGQPQPTNSGGSKPLGWLSDRRGIPCITGARITNAPQYLGGRFLARAIGAAGNAYARSQTTVTSSALTGGVTSGVTGDPTQYALGAMASGSADELSQWISERQAQNYDAIFVDTGAEVALHIDRELPIDFEPKGRKLAYARKKHPQSDTSPLAQLD